MPRAALDTVQTTRSRKYHAIVGWSFRFRYLRRLLDPYPEKSMRQVAIAVVKELEWIVVLQSLPGSTSCMPTFLHVHGE